MIDVGKERPLEFQMNVGNMILPDTIYTAFYDSLHKNYHIDFFSESGDGRMKYFECSNQAKIPNL